jgi:large subunit ribosomal protein L21
MGLAVDHHYQHRHHHSTLCRTQILAGGAMISSSSGTAAALSRYSTSTLHPRFAVIDHSEAYETAMQGRHGQQLALARLEGLGRDELPFDPFLEEELLLASNSQDNDDDDDDDDDGAIAASGKNANTEKHGIKKEGNKKTEEEDDGDDDDEGYFADVSDGEEEDFDDDGMGPFNPDGSVRRPKSVLATLRAGYPAGGLFAIFELNGFQFKVTTDDLIVVNRLQPVDHFKIGSLHTLKDIMLVGSSHLTMVGLPYVDGAEVDVMVEEITQDAKVIIFKKRRRKNSQRKNGFRRNLTLLRVLDIRVPEEYKGHKHVGRDILDELDDEPTIIHQPTDSKATVSSHGAVFKEGSQPTNKNGPRDAYDDEEEEQRLKSA